MIQNKGGYFPCGSLLACSRSKSLSRPLPFYCNPPYTTRIVKPHATTWERHAISRQEMHSAAQVAALPPHTWLAYYMSLQEAWNFITGRSTKGLAFRTKRFSLGTAWQYMCPRPSSTLLSAFAR
ncbi:uncharacterized protein BDZ83DRAFT_657660 [Colletotrichum acutatum]|uniref:Uncharacterized protein n=1 Tax=Glomerella acutata TaxID=27357 RepID=A0AAD8UAS2_GLOAC|nr:uncharacterized protein BDZ83DRAFT_657660 [Colletotrichum acutatum]KAK1707765.1 hypothetical protein BDZ83DRAFT_657660 [Colletotrichum acutatum]